MRHTHLRLYACTHLLARKRVHTLTCAYIRAHTRVLVLTQHSLRSQLFDKSGDYLAKKGINFHYKSEVWYSVTCGRGALCCKENRPENSKIGQIRGGTERGVGVLDICDKNSNSNTILTVATMCCVVSGCLYGCGVVYTDVA